MAIQLQRPSAVLFDVGDTLLEERWFDLEAGIAAVVHDPSAARSLADEFRAQEAQCRMHNADLLLADWLRQRVPSLANQPFALVEDHVWSAVVRLIPKPDVGVVLARLSADGIPLAAVSNAAFSGRVLKAELQRHGLAAYLRFVVTSADAKSRKPALPIFQHAIESLGLPAPSIWFVGDSVDEDVVGALTAGLQPILIGHAVTDDVPVVRDWPDFLAVYLAAHGGGHARFDPQ